MRSFDLSKPFEVDIPMRTRAGPNQRLNTFDRARIVKRERNTMALLVQAAIKTLPDKIQITLTLISKNANDDDNVKGRLKAVRDGVADGLHVKDNDPRIEWRYAQARGPHGVRVRIQRAPSLTTKPVGV